jgi:hypothetical protein
MSLEHHPSRDQASASDYWHGLIDERAAADFLDLSVRIPMKTATYSDAKRPPIPIQSGHFFSGPN